MANDGFTVTVNSEFSPSDKMTQDVRQTADQFQESNLLGLNAVREKFLISSVSADLITKDPSGKGSSDI